MTAPNRCINEVKRRVSIQKFFLDAMVQYSSMSCGISSSAQCSALVSSSGVQWGLWISLFLMRCPIDKTQNLLASRANFSSFRSLPCRYKQRPGPRCRSRNRLGLWGPRRSDLGNQPEKGLWGPKDPAEPRDRQHRFVSSWESDLGHSRYPRSLQLWVLLEKPEIECCPEEWQEQSPQQCCNAGWVDPIQRSGWKSLMGWNSNSNSCWGAWAIPCEPF